MITDELIRSMAETWDKRQANWKHEYVTPDNMPTVAPPGDLMLRGTYSCCMMRSNRRIVDVTHCADIGYGRETISALSRDYLKAKYPKGNRIRHKQAALMHRMPAPLFVKPGILTAGAYVDMVRAYWQITRVVGWDVDYWPEKWIGVQSSNDDFPLSGNKLATNMLVSSCLPGGVCFIDDTGKITSRARWTQQLNLQLHMCVMMCLHAVANIARYHGAIYVNTDGAIIPECNVEAMIDEVKSRIGLVMRVKSRGYCEVKSVGAYHVGRSVSRRFDRAYTHATSNLYPDIDLLAWQRAKFYKLAVVRNEYLTTVDKLVTIPICYGSGVRPLPIPSVAV